MASMALSPSLLARRGTLLEVAGPPGAGVTSVLLSLLAPASAEAPVAYVDVRAQVSPLAACELGCDLDRLVFVRAPASDPEAWAKAVAYLLDGVPVVAAEAPRGIPASVLRALAGRVRSRDRLLAVAPLGWRLPSGLATGRLLLQADGMGRFRARLEGKLAQGGIVAGLITPPSLEIAMPPRRLAAVP